MVPRSSLYWLVAGLGCLIGMFEPAVRAQVNVTTQHNDNSRTGANTQETILTPANTNSAQFGKLFSVAVDGSVYAQPLYLSGVTINGGTHNVLYVATEHDSVYALDADTSAILWHVSLGWSSLCDVDTYHGWVMSYNAGTLAQEGVFNDTPNGGEGGIWMAGAGFAGDSNGNTFFATGNGTFNGTDEFGDSIVKLGAPGSNSFPLLDYFTPYNQATLSSSDLHLGSGGPLLLPDLPSGSAHPHLLTLSGKQGMIYLINRDSLGRYCNGCSSDTQIVQELPGALAGLVGAPAYWNGH